MKRSINNSSILIAAAILIVPVMTVNAEATNESSYKYGFGQGKSEFVNCQDFDADCTAAPDDCQSPVTTYAKNDTTGYYDIRTDHYDIMTNKTACIDGYSHGWEDSCQRNGTACVFLFNSGFLPDASIVRNINGTAVVCDVERTLCGNTDMTVKNGIIFPNGTAIPAQWHTDARGGWFGWTGPDGIWASKH